MKLLPCPRCGTAQTPSGEPLAIGRLSTPRITFTCGGCKRPVVITAREWNRLPESTATKFKDGAPLAPLVPRVKEASPIISPLSGALVQKGGGILQ